ncbi:hypothetical protein ISS30_02670 [bacterium]|nr:hypothetical protein [FCB group bacterium]MBL7190573.1 hypothetical protein [bacterium]
MKARIPIPNTLQNWLEEIAAGYKEAQETVPFAKLVGSNMVEKDFFHLAPLICLKFRGLPCTKKFREKVIEAALTSYVATENNNNGAFSNPHISFAFAYLASHYGLDLLTESAVNKIMNYIEQEQKQLAAKIIELDSR